MSIIEVKGLCKSFGSLNVLQNVDLNVEQGEKVAIIGGSGCGKSVLLRSLELLTKPDKGQIFIDGEEITKRGTDVDRIRRKLGMVYQGFNLFTHMDVMDNLCLAPTHLLKIPRVTAEAKALEQLRTVSLEDRAYSMPSELSGGQKQRIAIALVVYVAVMVVSYIGARYMEMSVFTPVSNASSGFAVVIILVYASLTGNYADVSVYITPASVIGMVLAVGGVIALAIVQSRMSQRTVQIGQQEKKYRVGVLALLFPLVFCLMDAVSVTIDSVNLGATGESVIGDYDYIRIYAAAYLVVSVVSWLVILAGTKKPYNPFKPFKASGYGAGLLEVIATTSYLLALGKNAVLSVPVASAYCIVTLIASRIILKEMLKLPQYVCIASVVIGVMLVSFVGL